MVPLGATRKGNCVRVILRSLVTSALEPMDYFVQIWQNQWDAYPQWLVLSAAIITGALVLWLCAKLLAWLMKVVLICVVVGVVVGVCVHFFA